jgi:hypothetical protein
LLSLLGTLLAWAVAGSQLGNVLHFSAISHEICQEHGELVHAGEHGDEHHAAPSPPAATTVSDSASEHAHEHCSVFGRPEDTAPVATPPSVEIAAVAATDVASLSPRASVFVAPSTRLLAAPKTSPPV